VTIGARSPDEVAEHLRLNVNDNTRGSMALVGALQELRRRA
jgi:hypothetical protein